MISVLLPELKLHLRIGILGQPVIIKKSKNRCFPLYYINIAIDGKYSIYI